MFKRLLLAAALGASLIACTPAGGSSPAATVEPTVVAPTDVAPSDAAPSESMPVESMPVESPSPSAS